MVVAIGDLHIDCLEAHIPDSHKKILSTFDKIVDKEVERGASDFVQLGDAFNDPYPEQQYIVAFIKSLKRHDKKVKWHLIMGNHDYADVRNNGLRIIRSLCDKGFINGKVYMKPEVVKIDDEKYFFCPHPYVLDQPSKVRYSFGHFGYDGAKGDNGYSIKSTDSPTGRWVLGDYHTYQRGRNYIYAGSVVQTKWHESQDKAYIRLEDSPRHITFTPDIRLGRATIDDISTLQQLDRSVYWSVAISRKVKLPPDWATQYPHVVRHHTEKAVNKRQQLLMEHVKSENPLKGLAAYLRGGGMEDKDIRRTFDLLGEKEPV
jgi:DNA repair exonuclease SbcCD nuclease subunit